MKKTKRLFAQKNQLIASTAQLPHIGVHVPYLYCIATLYKALLFHPPCDTLFIEENKIKKLFLFLKKDHLKTDPKQNHSTTIKKIYSMIIIVALFQIGSKIVAIIKSISFFATFKVST